MHVLDDLGLTAIQISDHIVRVLGQVCIILCLNHHESNILGPQNPGKFTLQGQPHS